MNKQFEIDIEETTQENAVFQGDDFLCYTNDIETLVDKLNELNNENEYLIKKRGNLATKNVILEDENDQLKKELDQFYLFIGRGDWSGLVNLIKE